MVSKINKESKEKFNNMRDKHFDPLYSSGEKSIENKILIEKSGGVKNFELPLNEKKINSSLNTNIILNNANKDAKFNFNLKNEQTIMKENLIQNKFGLPSPLIESKINNFSRNNKSISIANILQNKLNNQSENSNLSLSPPNSVRNKKSSLILNKNEPNKNSMPTLILNPSNIKNYKLKINQKSVIKSKISSSSTVNNNPSTKGSDGSDKTKNSPLSQVESPKLNSNNNKSSVVETNSNTINRKIDLKRKSMTIKHKKEEFKLDLKTIGESTEIIDKNLNEESGGGVNTFNKKRTLEKEKISYEKHNPPHTMKPKTKVSSINFNKLKFYENKNEIKLNYGSEEATLNNNINTINSSNKEIDKFNFNKNIVEKIKFTGNSNNSHNRVINKRSSVKEMSSNNIKQHIAMNSINLNSNSTLNNLNNLNSEKKENFTRNKNKLKISIGGTSKFYYNFNINYDVNIPTSINNVTDVILPPIKTNNKNMSSKQLNKASSSKQLIFFNNANHL
jgi:hypothetical protein